MSKYEPLWKAIGRRTENSFTLTYAEIEQILGFTIDHAATTAVHIAAAARIRISSHRKNNSEQDRH